MKRTLFVLTNGNDVFDQREMTMTDLQKAQLIAALVNLFWVREDARIDAESIHSRRIMMRRQR